MSLRTGSFLLGMAALAACGGTVNGDDTMGDDVVDPPDTTAPVLMSSTPADNATKVAPLAALTFTFDEALDPTSVTNASVTVTYPNPTYIAQINGTVAYDAASHTITFAPKLPLLAGLKYTVKLASSIKDEAGNAFGGDDLSFISSVNNIVKEVYYDTSTGQANYWSQYTLNANGRVAKLVSFGAGPDTVALTPDDVADQHIEQMYNAAGQVTEYRYFGPGADTRYNTSDDVIRSVQYLTYDAEGRQRGQSLVTGAGLDGSWGTADDVLTNHQTYTSTGNVIRYTVFSGPGNDGVWKTPDDRTTTYYEYTYNALGALERWDTYSSGPDQLAKTSDDVMSEYYEYTNDDNGTLLTTRYRNSPGPDMTWLTADDLTSSYEAYQVDANGYRIGLTYSNNPGSDAVYGTADDVIRGRIGYTSDTNGLQTSVTSFNGAGPDAMWGTADDPVSSYRKFTYDLGGQRTDQKYYSSPGPDMVWKNQDDRVFSIVEFDTAH
ncbi:MAG: Ig-like domain-containing protein [Deltaproteobacteria bacterium]|nr:Ig-like domain-containing protein [Deltaproteobacteria bacterium]